MPHRLVSVTPPPNPRIDDIAEREGGTRLQLNALGFAVDHPATAA
jgi:hypothetical protein